MADEPAIGAVLAEDGLHIRATGAVVILMLDQIIDRFDVNRTHGWLLYGLSSAGLWGI